jgi:serine/threonine protein kinase
VERKIDKKILALKKIIVKKDKKESLDNKIEKVNKEIEIMQNIATPKCNPYISCYIGHEIIKQKNKAIIYLEMEYIKGKTIDKYILPFIENDDIENVLQIIYLTAKYICMGLKIVHEKNIIHQDIKPENIIVQEETKTPILVDFGLSCIAKPKGDECIFDKCCKSGGSVDFMAPERLSYVSNVSYPKSDVWSLGATLFFVLFRKNIRDSKKLISNEIEKINTEYDLLNNLINGMTELEINKRYSVDFVLEILKNI